GPALVRACDLGEEEIVLARGVVTASMGAGVRPGADVWLATRVGLVRWGDATLRATVTAAGDRLLLAAETGSAGVVPASGSSPSCPKVLPAGAKCELVLAGASKKDGPAGLRKACVEAAEQAALLGALVLSPSSSPDAGTLGDRTARHIEARQAARG